MPLALLACLLLNGCGAGSDEVEGEPETQANPPKLVGRIASVNDAQGFALVEGYGDWRLGEGLLLSSVGKEGRTATLMSSGERMGRFAAADLKGGSVEVGDLVYARQIEAEATPSMTGDGIKATEPVPVESSESAASS